MVRGYHYTGNLDSVLKHGLDTSFAKGSTYGEPNTLWFSAEKPGNFKDYVEVFLKWEELDLNGWHRNFPPSQADLDKFNAGQSNFTVRPRQIPPDRFVTHHRPWHDKYRYLQKYWPPDAPETWRESMMGTKTPDKIVAEFLEIDNPDYAPAVALWAAEYEAHRKAARK